MKLEHLKWDSEFFGLRIGRVDISVEAESCALVEQFQNLNEEFDLLYVFAQHGLEFKAPGAKLVDQKVVYSMLGPVYNKPSSRIILWDSTQGVTDDLLHLALLSGKHSRFKMDKGFPLDSYDRLYSRWIEQSVNHNLATEVFCYMVEDVPRGLVTLDFNNGVGTIGLVAIHEEFQHQGIGYAMMEHVIGFVQQNHGQKMSVATQLANVAACRLYEKSGFTMGSINDIWHWWL